MRRLFLEKKRVGLDNKTYALSTVGNVIPTCF